MASSFFLLLICCISFVILGVTANPCLIQTPTGTFDLSVANNPNQDYVYADKPNAKGQSNTYYLQPCANTITSCGGVSTPGCQFDTNDNPHYLGSLTEQTVDEASGYAANVTYSGGQSGLQSSRSMSILFVCDPTTNGAPSGLVVETLLEYTFVFKTMAVCRGGGGGTSISKNIQTDTVWDESGSPYVIQKGITVYPGITLEISGAAVYGLTNTILNFGSLTVTNSTLSNVAVSSPEPSTSVSITSSSIQDSSLYELNQLLVYYSFIEYSNVTDISSFYGQNSTFVGSKFKVQSGTLSYVDFLP